LSKLDWLLDNTERFCQDKAIYNGVVESISILDGKNKEYDKGAIPDILSKALAVSFDNYIGHDYIENYKERYEFYHRTEEKIPFDLTFFNKITKGGLPKKSLTVILGGSGGGKSLFLCHHSACCLMQGKNVLYITMEMAEERIAERIDANLLDVNLDDLVLLSEIEFTKKIQRLKNKQIGKLVIKEYPTGQGSVIHFRNLLNELNLKKNFVPDIIMVDYLNICASARVKGSNANSYTLVKSISEELRGMAMEFNVPIFTATQMIRSALSSSDPSMEDVSESIGTVFTTDVLFALVTTEELEQLGQIMVKQIKNRYSDPTKNKRFVIGIDRPKMKLYDLEEVAQENIANSGQTNSDEPKYQKTINKKSFESLKY
jgi:archaellum biogenesis ATPase FlaH